MVEACFEWSRNRVRFTDLYIGRVVPEMYVPAYPAAVTRRSR